MTKPNELTKVMVCGCGRIGEVIATILSDCGDYFVTVVDKNKDQFHRFDGVKNVETKLVDLSNQDDITKAAQGQNFLVSTAPYFLTMGIAHAAHAVGAHYIDLTEDVRTSDAIRKIAEGSQSAFIPQSGLAPGFISILGNHIAQKFDKLDDLRLRVGALAKYPNNAIKYNLSWSTAGLVNEYCHPCNAIVDGELQQVQALEGYEHFTINGANYECFNTSGGLGTLCETYKGKVNSLNYKSVRYPGHLDIMRFLIHDLKMKDKQDVLVELLEDAIPYTNQDAVLIYVEASGMRDGIHSQDTYAIKVYAGEVANKYCSAIQITTAGSACAVIDLVRDGTLPQKGFIKQEDIKFDDFIENRFGRVYAPGEITAEAL